MKEIGFFKQKKWETLKIRTFSNNFRFIDDLCIFNND